MTSQYEQRWREILENGRKIERIMSEAYVEAREKNLDDEGSEALVQKRLEEEGLFVPDDSE